MEFELLDDIFESAEDGLEDAPEEGSESREMSEEELKEFKEEAQEAKEGVKDMGKAAEDFKKKSEPGTLKEVGIFFAKTTAIGVILFGVNLGLSKLIKLAKGGEEGKKSSIRKRGVVTALITLIKAETKMNKTLLDWMNQHKDENVTLQGIDVPLESVFHKYMGPISEAVEKAFQAAKPLQKKIDGKVSWMVPTAEDVGNLLNASAAYVTAFDDLQKFAVEQSSKFPDLKTFPLTQENVDDLRNQVDVVKAMPFN